MRRLTLIPIAFILLCGVAPVAHAEDRTGEPTQIEPMPPVEAAEIFASDVRLEVGGEVVPALRPGERTTVLVTLLNPREEAARGVVATVRDAPGLRVLDGHDDVGSIAARESGTARFIVELVGDECVEGLGMAASIESSFGEAVTKWAVQAACPGPRLVLERLEFTGGDEDGVPEEGELIQVHVSLRNVGADPAETLSGRLTVARGDVTIVEGAAIWPDVGPGETETSSAPLVIRIGTDGEDATCPPIMVEPLPGDGNEPVSGGGGEPGSGGGAVTGVMVAPVPERGTTEQDPAASDTSARGGSEPGAAPTEPSLGVDDGSIEPDDQVIDPVRPGGRGEEPVDPGASFSLSLQVRAAEYRVELPIEHGPVCALAEMHDATAAAPGRLAGDRSPPKPSRSAGAVGVAVVAAAAASAGLLRRLLASRAARVA